MKYLVVVSHPDDEVLGAGATINKLVKQGNEVAVATMSNHAAARVNLSDTLRSDQGKALSLLGVTQSYTSDFPNIRMNTVPHIELVQFVENCILDWGAEAIITHHPADTNNDHVMTSHAVQAAMRIYQRKDEIIMRIKRFHYMEVLSASVVCQSYEEINNGVEVSQYESGILQNYIEDADLGDETFKVIYAGAIRELFLGVALVKKFLEY